MDRAEPAAGVRGAGAAVTLRLLLALGLVLAGCGPALHKTAPEPDRTPEATADDPGPPAADDTSPGQGTQRGDDGAADRDEVKGPVASAPEDTAPPPPPEGRAALAERIQALVDVAVSSAADTDLAVLVTDAYGRPIAEHRPDVPVLPASTMKVVTAAALLRTLGPDARLTTRVEATAPIGSDGALRGDLVLVGDGDPALATDEYGRWVYPIRPRTPISALVDQLVDAGLTTVTGDVVGIAPSFEGPARAEGWADRYFSDLDARYASGLTVDAGLHTLVEYPDEGDDADDADDADGGTDVADPDAAGPDAAQDGAPPTVTVDHVADPAAHAATELVRLLEARDVRVAGQGRSGEVEGPTVGRLAEVESPTMEELLRFAVQRSDNQLMDGLFQTLGRLRTGRGSWERGDRAVRQVLDRFGIEHGDAVFADGSGLSRDDRLTARLLVELDRHMSTDRHAATWDSLMAVMGESGTLRKRLVGTVAAGRFRGKTGSLRDVTALSGSVVGVGEERYHLAVIANDAVGDGRWIARQLMDQLVLRLAADTQDCAVRDPEPAEEPTPVPAAVISC